MSLFLRGRNRAFLLSLYPFFFLSVSSSPTHHLDFVRSHTLSFGLPLFRVRSLSLSLSLALSLARSLALSLSLSFSVSFVFSRLFSLSVSQRRSFPFCLCIALSPSAFLFPFLPPSFTCCFFFCLFRLSLGVSPPASRDDNCAYILENTPTSRMSSC